MLRYGAKICQQKHYIFSILPKTLHFVDGETPNNKLLVRSHELSSSMPALALRCDAFWKRILHQFTQLDCRLR